MEKIQLLIDNHKSKSILYVEDEDFIRQQMTKTLLRIFDDVTTAVDGEDALIKYASRQFDMILTDIHMPNLDGVALTKTILKKSPTQKIVIMTAFNQNNELSSLLDFGVKKIITKPVALPDLFNTFLEVLG